MCAKHAVSNSDTFLYAVYKQQYLELLERQESQKVMSNFTSIISKYFLFIQAFTFLNKRLKPLERFAASPAEFKDLCFLLTCKSVQDAPSFKNWDGAKGRSRFVRFKRVYKSNS